MTTVLTKLKLRGYWAATIRPSHFKSRRVQIISDLFPIVQKASVQLRGWDFPHVDNREPPRIDVDWVGQEVDWQHHVSMWRFFQSGQFHSVSGFVQDWRDQSGIWPKNDGWKHGQYLGVIDTVFTFTELFEFAARLAMTPAGDESMRIEVKFSKIQGRYLLMEDHRAWPSQPRYVAKIDEFPWQDELLRADLVAKPRQLALEWATELFRRFDWNPSIELLRSMQDDLRK